MAENTFKVTIITPDGTVYDNDKVTMLVMNTAGGQMGIMANHVPLIAALEISTVRIKHSEGTDEVAAVNGGIIQFDGQNATIAADSAEMPEAIDVERAQRAKSVLSLQSQKQRRSITKATYHVQKFTSSVQLTV